jgi:hypothetical protein
MPILGIIASSFRSAAGPEGAYDSLATVTVPSGGVASITFAGIPSGYKHLQIRAICKMPQYESIILRFNGISSNSYSRHYIQGSGSAANAGGAANLSSITNLLYADGSATSNYGAFITDILDYSSTNKNKTTRTLWGQDFNGSGYVGFDSGAFYSTNAVSTITLTTSGAATISEYSSFALYGVK